MEQADRDVARARDEAALLSSLAHLGRAMNAARTTLDVATFVAEAARSALQADAVSLSRYEPEHRRIRVVVNVGDLAEWEQRHPEDEFHAVGDYESLSRFLLNGQSGAFSVDDPRCPSTERAHLEKLGKASSLSVAVWFNGRVWGELYATRTAGRSHFTQTDVGVAEAVAGFVALGLGQADQAAQAARLAYEDMLTGLPNRRALEERLDLAIDRHLAAGIPVHLVVCDINGLKEVNDAFGHDTGDRLLRDVGRILAEAAQGREGVTPARLGGDEFCILFVDRPHEEAVELANEICTQAAALRSGGGLACGVASTEGVMGASVDSPRRLFRLADAAQYRAKRSRSPGPVVVGQGLSSDPGGLAEVSAERDRRALRARLEVDYTALLAAATQHMQEARLTGVGERLDAVALLTANVVDAGSWWTSWLNPGSRTLRTRAGGVVRHSAAASPEWDTISLLGKSWELDDYPASERAIFHGVPFIASLDAPGNDPAEESMLILAGYTSVIGVGGVDRDGGGWLLEIMGDELTAPLEGAVPVLQALLAIALTSPVAAGEDAAEPRPGQPSVV